ncbi:MAG TPA: GAF domain-containing protein [Thermoplasmata archaeon]|nr:GAF domain-containing protein [Thermoplasmata archaeon]
MLPGEETDETQILAALLGIAEMVGGLPDAEEVLAAIVRIAPSLVKVDRCALLTYDETSREFHTLESFGPSSAPSYEGLVLREADMPRLAQRLVKQRLPIVMKDASKDPLVPAAVAQRLGLRSVLIAPVVCRGRFIGALWLDSTAGPHYFTSKEINVVAGIATEAAITLDASRTAEALANERRRFAALAGSLCEGVITVGPDLRIASLDPGAERLLGWTTSETRGRRMADVFDISEAEAGISWTKDAAGPSPVRKSLKLRAQDGRLVECRVAAAVVRDDGGEIVEILYALMATGPGGPPTRGGQIAEVVTPASRPE